MEFIYDFVLCIEATNNFKPYKEKVAEYLKHLFISFLEKSEATGHVIKLFRVKLLYFRDVPWCSNPFVESPFFEIGKEMEIDHIIAFINSMQFEDGHGRCNALEALALALKSQWYATYNSRRVILMFSNGEVRPLGGNQTALPTYPAGMPKSTAELSRWFEGHVPVEGFKERATFVIVNAPEAEPWSNEIIRMQGVFFSPVEFLCDIDKHEIDSIVNVFVYNGI